MRWLAWCSCSDECVRPAEHTEKEKQKEKRLEARPLKEAIAGEGLEETAAGS